MQSIKHLGEKYAKIHGELNFLLSELKVGMECPSKRIGDHIDNPTQVNKKVIYSVVWHVQSFPS